MKIRRRIALKRRARELRQLRDKCAKRPVAGTHVGGGRHVDMPATWDRVGLVPPGWSGLNGEVEEFDDIEDDATSVGFRLDFPRNFVSRVNNSKRLTEEEKATLLAEFAKADPDREEGDETVDPRPRHRGRIHPDDRPVRDEPTIST